MKRRRLGILLLFSLLLAACGSSYDVGTADTEANRNGFSKHLGFEPSSDVTGVYYFADALGADARYQLAFQCPQEVAERIIESLSLQPKPADYSGLAPRADFTWWTSSSLEGLPVWIKDVKDGQYFREFYYSEEDGRAYYHEYSL